MILKVKCLCCGKEGKVLVILKRIISRWGFWGVIKSPKNGKIEYWECPKCMGE